MRQLSLAWLDSPGGTPRSARPWLSAFAEDPVLVRHGLSEDHILALWRSEKEALSESHVLGRAPTGFEKAAMSQGHILASNGFEEEAASGHVLGKTSTGFE